MDDAGAIWTLVQESGVLDVNSSYCYLVLCEYFAETTVVVRQGDRLAGFLTALVSPDDMSRLFVWQVGVSAADRSRGLAKHMLRHLLARSACQGVTHIETTVSPSNIPSNYLFSSLARDLDTTLEARGTYSPEFFPESDHEPEQRLLLGPFNPETLSRS